MQPLFTKVGNLKAELASYRPLDPAALRRIRDDFVIENTYDTNAIEGSTLTLRETALILKEDITIAEKPLHMHLDAIGHRNAFEYMLTIADPGDNLTESRIKQLHTLVYMNDTLHKGVYRNVPVMIQGSSQTPPQPYLVASQMEALIAEYDSMKKNQHIIAAIAEFHLKFEAIHSFIDGNGRTGRLIINLELIKAGLLPVNIKFADRRQYYNCFDDYFGEKQSADSLTQLLLNYEIAELERYIQIVKYANEVRPN